MNRRDAIKYLSVYRKTAGDDRTGQVIGTTLGAVGGGTTGAIAGGGAAMAASGLFPRLKIHNRDETLIGAGLLGGSLLGSLAGGRVGYKFATPRQTIADKADVAVQDNPGKAMAVGALGAAGIATLLYLALKKKKKA